MSSDFDRPNPEKLLKAIQQTNAKNKSGSLKIYLGMAAGVGKTFAMLEDAQRLHSMGTNVVVGSVETHGRSDTARLLEGLKIVPERWIEYRGTPFRELDLDEILSLNPDLVIVDELAHSNVPGSRHTKRWQDVEEILDKGISVFTTLNVQHIESLRDVVEQITGIQIIETVPDSIIEGAASIELIDLTPTELLQRLKEGKVYLGPQAEIAIAHFFQEDRLTALRELALRYTAEKVDHDLRGMVSSVEREEAWKPRERILVLVSESPKNQKMIRVARRLSFVLNAPWIALHVDQGKELNEIERTTLSKNMTMARELGAEVIVSQDPNLTDAIKRVAKQWGVTQIILGRGRKNPFYFPFFKETMIDSIVKDCPDLDVHVIRHSGSAVEKLRKKAKLYPESWMPYIGVAAIIGFLSLLNIWINEWFGYRTVGFIFLVGILLLSLYFRRGPILFASLLAGGIWDYFFIPTDGAVTPERNEDFALLTLFFLTAIFTGILTDRVRMRQEMLVKREGSTEALYSIAKAIATASGQKQLVETVLRKLGRVLNGECRAVIIDSETDQLDSKQLKKDYKIKEQAAIEWVFENGKEAGWSTNTLPLETSLYVPLKTASDTYGVLVFKPKPGQQLDINDKNFLHTVSQLLSNALEKLFVEEETKKDETLRQTEKVYQTVLGMLSEKFVNPFQSLHETVGELKQADESVGRRLIYRIEHTSEGLIRDIENISSMAKLNTGKLGITKVRTDIHKLIGVCFSKLEKVVADHKIKVDIPSHLPLIPLDPSLMQVLLNNLLVNAIQNSPVGSTVEVKAYVSKNEFFLCVLDEGKGIPKEMLETIFEKFTRGPSGSKSGLGLGLSIARNIAEAHGGSLTAENRPSGGSILTFSLPL